MRSKYRHGSSPFVPKPVRGTNRERRRKSRRFYKDLANARKIGLHHDWFLGLSTKKLAHTFKRANGSSYKFRMYHMNCRLEDEWEEISLLADY